MEGRFRLAYTMCTPECEQRSPMAYDAGFEEALTELAGLGYEGVELAVRDPAEIDGQWLHGALARAGLGVAALSSGPVASDDGLTFSAADPGRSDAAVQRVADIIDLAAGLGALVTIGRVRGAPASDDPKGRSAAVAAITALSAHAAHSGVRIALEPQNRFVGPYLNTVGEVVELLASGGWENVGIVADTFHMGIEEASIPGALVRASSHLLHVQLGDSNRGALGAGSLRLSEVLDTLRALGYAGWLTMEHAQVPSSRQAATRSAMAVQVADPARWPPPGLAGRLDP